MLDVDISVNKPALHKASAMESKPRAKSRLVSEDMAEKMRQVLSAKRESIVSRKIFEGNDGEKSLIEWVKMQNSYRLPVDGIPDAHKIKNARTLVEMYGDPVLK